MVVCLKYKSEKCSVENLLPPEHYPDVPGAAAQRWQHKP